MEAQEQRKQFFRWFIGKRVMACAQQVGDVYRVGLAFRNAADTVPNPDLARKIATGRFEKKGFEVSQIAVESDGLEGAIRERVGEMSGEEYTAPEFSVEALHQVARKLRMPVWFLKECW